MKKLFKILVNVIIFLLVLFVFFGIITSFEGLLNYGEFRPSGDSTVGQVVLVFSGLLSWLVTKKINRKIFKG